MLLSCVRRYLHGGPVSYKAQQLVKLNLNHQFKVQAYFHGRTFTITYKSPKYKEGAGHCGHFPCTYYHIYLV